LYEDDISDKLKTKRWRILNDLLLKNIKKRSKLMIGREEVVLVE
jgi:tRNA A37 methylthiotransferase MiaB